MNKDEFDDRFEQIRSDADRTLTAGKVVVSLVAGVVLAATGFLAWVVYALVTWALTK